VIIRVRIVIFVLGIANSLNIPFYQNVTGQIAPVTNISENIRDVQRVFSMDSTLGSESNVSGSQDIRDDKS
jgi:hypothetical protein